jgi:hypothetical protein
MQSEAVLSRRDLLSLIGAMAGSAAMYHAMTSLGFASESPYKGPLKLEGDPKGASVLVLGAGLAGMAAAIRDWLTGSFSRISLMAASLQITFSVSWMPRKSPSRRHRFRPARCATFTPRPTTGRNTAPPGLPP